jgi:uncharacterized membrane protein YcaP (DUF421 family)
MWDEEHLGKCTNMSVMDCILHVEIGEALVGHIVSDFLSQFSYITLLVFVPVASTSKTIACAW